MKIGTNLQRIRKAKDPKITQQDLAKATGLSRSYLSDVEHNRYNPSLDTTIALAEALDVTVNDLVYTNVHTNSKLVINDNSETININNLNDNQIKLLKLYIDALTT
ncbi:TPA: helix-turn-helix domain-containing protein [Clostridium perfringens]|uniref:helix-turn-helix domain-containing protein n=2 Tax=Clostridium perfringens TaxID=1502 RepID=UPI000166671F|nr:helix-turn-helix transcriptional regulator [Clostridium perfringens]EDS79590.1 DNA-binding protein [Clostridium perfringens C str. JGS1495]MBI6030252.1 helix-turn-helix transcriptional regulator [Clostridium perfringens]MBI6033481.1 helix-turn-helix transcriptional regulator [Clostridium perfringens]MBI6068022.1 helix-turn-helix transcriptional regulator [Clostridium perfringens]MBI6096819.1 helix-turn-helix transcriptional regulator [Clostridium perfringens]